MVGSRGTLVRAACTLLVVLAASGCADEAKDSPDYRQGYEILAPGGTLEFGYNNGVSPTSDDCLAALDLVLTAMPDEAPDDRDDFLDGCNDYIDEAY